MGGGGERYPICPLPPTLYLPSTYITSPFLLLLLHLPPVPNPSLPFFPFLPRRVFPISTNHFRPTSLFADCRLPIRGKGGGGGLQPSPPSRSRSLAASHLSPAGGPLAHSPFHPLFFSPGGLVLAFFLPLFISNWSILCCTVRDIIAVIAARSDGTRTMAAHFGQGTASPRQLSCPPSPTRVLSPVFFPLADSPPDLGDRIVLFRSCST